MYVSKIDCRTNNAPREFTKSLHESGFAILQHHPVELSLLKDVYESWEAFFIDEGKHEFLFDPVSQDGYFPFRSENAKGSTV